MHNKSIKKVIFDFMWISALSDFDYFRRGLCIVFVAGSAEESVRPYLECVMGVAVGRLTHERR